MKKWMPWLALVAILIIAVAVYFISKNSTTVAVNYPIEGAIEPRQETPDISPDAKQIDFKSKIEVRETSIAIDGAVFQSVACSRNRNKALVFGFLLLDKVNRAQLACADDYLRGISLLYENKHGESQNINLGMVDGDAGDEWDSRSWISRDSKSGDIVILHVSLASAEDIETQKPIECSVSKVLYTWDAENKMFSESTNDIEFDLKKFTPPIGVAPECLDVKGFWKGS